MQTQTLLVNRPYAISYCNVTRLQWANFCIKIIGGIVQVRLEGTVSFTYFVRFKEDQVYLNH